MTTDVSTTNPNAGAGPAAGPLGFGASKLLKHQMRTGRMMTAGAGRPPGADQAAPAARPAESASDSLAAAPVASGEQPALGLSAAPAAHAPASAFAPPESATGRVTRPFGFGAAPAASLTPGPSSSAYPVAPAKATAAAPSAGAGSTAPVRAGFSFGMAAPAASPSAAPTRGTSDKAAPRPSFAADIAASRQNEAARVHISTVKLLMRLLGSVATNPGLMASEQTRSKALQSRHLQAVNMGEALTQQCLGARLAPEWMRSQAVNAAADAMCEALNAGMAPEQIEAFDERLAVQIVDIAREGEAIAGRVGFDGYVVADTVETAQARLYVSVTSAIGRLCVHGIEPQRAGAAVGEIVGHLEATEAFAGTKLDLRTAWLQGSLGRCVDLMITIMEAPVASTEVHADVDRLEFAQRQALSLIQEVENYAQSFIQRKFGHADGQAEVHEADPGAVPRAG